MKKNILVLTGSPRIGGNSDLLADAFIKGANKAGHEVVKCEAGKKMLWGVKPVILATVKESLVHLMTILIALLLL